MARLRELAQEAGRETGPLVTLHQSIRLGGEASESREPERRPGRGTPQQVREDLQRYQELGIAVVVCNFAAPDLPGLWRDMESFAGEVMPDFPEPG